MQSNVGDQWSCDSIERRVLPRYRFYAHLEMILEAKLRWGRVCNVSGEGMFIETSECPAKKHAIPGTPSSRDAVAARMRRSQSCAGPRHWRDSLLLERPGEAALRRAADCFGYGGRGGSKGSKHSTCERSLPLFNFHGHLNLTSRISRTAVERETTVENLPFSEMPLCVLRRINARIARA